MFGGHVGSSEPTELGSDPRYLIALICSLSYLNRAAFVGYFTIVAQESDLRILKFNYWYFRLFF
jgi:hypothetical protein